MENEASIVVPLNLSGDKFTTTFWDVYITENLLNKVLPNINTEYAFITKEFESINDHRSLALVGAMLVENKIDELIKSYIPGFESITNKDVTFSFKIELAKAFKLIPSKILNGIEPIRQIRNGFAHKLELKSFEDYNQSQSGSKKNDFKSVKNKLNTMGKFGNSSLESEYKVLVTTLIYALLIYTEQINTYMEKVKDPKFINDLFKNADTLFMSNDNYDPVPISKLNLSYDSDHVTTDEEE